MQNKKRNSPQNTNNVVNHILCPAMANLGKPDDTDLDTSGFASETTEREQKSLEDYKMATANAVIAPEIVIDSSDAENLTLKSHGANNKTTHNLGEFLQEYAKLLKIFFSSSLKAPVWPEL